MTWTLAVVTALAETLAASGVGRWSPTGAYPAGAVPAITVASTPDTPERIVTLSPYGVDDTLTEHSTVGIQVRCRAGSDPRDAYEIDDAVFAVLHNHRGSLGVTAPVRIALAWRQSGPAPLGLDPAGRVELTSNYYVLLGRGSAAPSS